MQDFYILINWTYSQLMWVNFVDRLHNVKGVRGKFYLNQLVLSAITVKKTRGQVIKFDTTERWHNLILNYLITTTVV